MKKLAALLLCSLLVVACGHTLKSAVTNGQIAPSFNDTLWDDNYLWVRGFGAPNPQHTTDSQRRILSREAAIAHAYQRASEVVFGTDLEAHVQVVDATTMGSSVDTSTQGMIQHMELVETEYLEDGGCTVILRLPRTYLQQAGLNPQEKK